MYVCMYKEAVITSVVHVEWHFRCRTFETLVQHLTTTSADAREWSIYLKSELLNVSYSSQQLICTQLLNSPVFNPLWNMMFQNWYNDWVKYGLLVFVTKIWKGFVINQESTNVNKRQLTNLIVAKVKWCTQQSTKPFIQFTENVTNVNAFTKVLCLLHQG